MGDPLGRDVHFITKGGRHIPIPGAKPAPDMNHIDPVKSARSKENYVPVTSKKVKQSTKDEIELAQLLKGIHFGLGHPHNSPLDFWNGLWAVEVKTMYPGKKDDKIDMRKECRERKYEAAAALKTNGLTIAVDRRSGAPEYYWKYGYGAYRLGGMNPTTLSDLKKRFGI